MAENPSAQENSDADFTQQLLADREWNRLVDNIHDGQVIPVVGPELVTVPDESNPGETIPLYRWFARRLCKRLDVKPARDDLNAVCCEFLLQNGIRDDLYHEIRDIIREDFDFQPNQALRDLAGIEDFNFLISTTFDPLLARALEAERSGFSASARQHLLSFHPSQPEDIPRELPEPALLYHILGLYNRHHEFAIWDEDYMEFVFGLNDHRDTLENLFRLLTNRYLLLLGAPYQDWIVRFFLRAVKQKRFSDRSSSEFLADRRRNLSDSMVFFFDKVVHSTRIVPGDPSIFVSELAKRWRERHGQTELDWETLKSRLPSEAPHNSVFISYARQDKEAVLKLVNGLIDARVPVWLDLDRLEAGANYERDLHHAVMESSFFVSVISQTTVADTERQRYFHKERDWAANRHVDGFVLYVPAVIDDSHAPWHEPDVFAKIHYHRLKGETGDATAAFCQRVAKLYEEFRVSGRPRA